VSGHDEPGVRYRAYKIDYGCYVQLLKTAKSPLGLFLGDDEKFIEVPPDDYRAIRRSILDVRDFNSEKFKREAEAGGMLIVGRGDILYATIRKAITASERSR